MIAGGQHGNFGRLIYYPVNEREGRAARQLPTPGGGLFMRLGKLWMNPRSPQLHKVQVSVSNTGEDSMRLVVEPWARHLTLPPLRAAMIDLEGPETVSMR